MNKNMNENKNENEREACQGTPAPAPEQVSDSVVENGRPKSVPTDAEALDWGRQIRVPEEYTRKFMAHMESKGWGYVNPGGSFVALCRRNFKAVLSSFYERDQKGGGRGGTSGGTSDTALHTGTYTLRLGKEVA